MAVITLDFHSKALKMCTLVTLVVPDSVRIKGIPLSARRTVYLLHGLSEDATAFLRLSGAERYARAHDLVLVMPTGGRSMYCDGINGPKLVYLHRGGVAGISASAHGAVP